VSTATEGAAVAVVAEHATTGAVLITFAAGRYAVAMEQVAEVATVPPLTLLPRMPHWVAGAANWRGRVLPVLDLRPLLGLPGHSLTSAARLVVLTADGVEVAILAESVPGVVEPLTDLRPLPEGSDSPLLAGVAQDPSGPVAVIDPLAVLGLGTELPAG
jgi:purine-binding chemotaxis protein CheW